MTDLRSRRNSRRWAPLALLCVASFMMILDSQIVILALPSIQTELGLSATQAQWILTANAVAFGGLLLLGGRAADLLGRRLVFMLGVLGFLVTSVVSGIAWNGTVLIGARALHGFSSAAMVPSALSILMNTFPEGRERNKAIAVWSALGGIGAVAGLLAGGGLTTAFGWEWVFLVNVPVVLGVLVLAPFVLRESKDHTQNRKFDTAGAVTVTAALVALIYAFTTAPAVGWGSTRTIVLFTVAAALIALFVLIESRSAAPLLPLHLLRKRSVVAGNLLLVLGAMVVWGEGVLLSLHTQQVLGYSALASGLASAAMPVMAVAGAYLGQANATKRGLRKTAAPAAVTMAVACVLLAQLPTEGSYVLYLLGPLIVFGLGQGAGHTAAMIGSLTGVDERDSGLASGLNSASFQIGGAFGVALVTSVAVSVTAGGTTPAALASGFNAGFWFLAAVASGMAVVAALLPAFIRRARAQADLPSADRQLNQVA